MLWSVISSAVGKMSDKTPSSPAIQNISTLEMASFDATCLCLICYAFLYGAISPIAYFPWLFVSPLIICIIMCLLSAQGLKGWPQTANNR